MKRNAKLVSIMLLVVLFIGSMSLVTGCKELPGHYDRISGVLLSQGEFDALEPAEQALYEPVKYKAIDPDIKRKGDAGFALAKRGFEISSPFIPEPYRTGAALLLGFLTTTWGFLTNRKTKDTLDRVKLGAQITADSIDAFVRPSVDLFNNFKDRQTKKSKDTNAIMPDNMITIK